MVERYGSAWGDPDDITDMEGGAYVLYSDYARLEEALRGCVEIVEANQYDAIPGRFTAVCKGCGTKCGTKHANFCSYEMALTKAREVLGDA
jgi:hypothetical protein